MKFPSIDTLISRSIATFRRFPFVLFIAIIGSFAAMLLIESDWSDETYYLENLFHTALLGLSLMLSLTLFSEQRNIQGQKKLLINIGGLLLLVGYFFYLPAGELTEKHVIRAILLGIGFHLLVAFAPFIRKGHLNGFWHYNKYLFMQILTAVLYSGVLYSGLALAILAVDQLFNADISGEIYGHLFIFLAGIFNTWFFLSNVPADYKALDEDDDYPRGLKIFTQYVLIPLVTIYLVILYVYSLKILFLWELPEGWVSYLVLGFSIAGIFSLLLVYPILDSAENKWVRIYGKWFYWALFPLILLLFVAIGVRIADYGITENRYFVLVLALWLLGISIYMLATQQRNIKIIPVSLFIIAILSSFGPWSAFFISKQSQLMRLENYLEKHEMLKNGFVQPKNQDIPTEDEQEMAAITDYLVNKHGYQSLQSIFAQDLDSLLGDTSRYQHEEILLAQMNISHYVDPNYSSSYFQLRASQNYEKALVIRGYDYLLDLNFSYYFYDYSGNDEENPDTVITYEYQLNTTHFHLDFAPYKGKVSTVLGEDSSTIDLDLKAHVVDLIEKYNNRDNYDIPPQEMQLRNENHDYAVLLKITNVQGDYNSESDEFELEYVTGKVLVELKQDSTLKIEVINENK